MKKEVYALAKESFVFIHALKMEFKDIFEWQKNVIDGTHIQLDGKLFNMPLRIGIAE